MAGPDGTLNIRWSCEPDQAGTTWELTATGATSAKTVTFIFSGALTAEEAIPADGADGAAAATPEVTTAPAAGALAIELLEDPFVCNSETRVFGSLTGAEPGEEIAFTSPQATGIRNGTADASGNLDIRWSCDSTQAGTTWELTATGVASARVGTVSFTGS